MIMKYHDRSGIVIKAKYPEEKLEVINGTLMNVFSMHEFSKEAGIASLTVGEINIVTYYTYFESNYFFILVLNMNENPDDYEEILREISEKVMENLGEEKYIKLLPSLFNEILESNY